MIESAGQFYKFKINEKKNIKAFGWRSGWCLTKSTSVSPKYGQMAKDATTKEEKMEPSNLRSSIVFGKAVVIRPVRWNNEAFCWWQDE